MSIEAWLWRSRKKEEMPDRSTEGREICRHCNQRFQWISKLDVTLHVSSCQVAKQRGYGAPTAAMLGESEGCGTKCGGDVVSRRGVRGASSSLAWLQLNLQPNNTHLL